MSGAKQPSEPGVGVVVPGMRFGGGDGGAGSRTDMSSSKATHRVLGGVDAIGAKSEKGR